MCLDNTWFAMDQIRAPALAQVMLPIKANATAFPGAIKKGCDMLVRFSEGIANRMVQFWPGLTKDQCATVASHECDVPLTEVTFDCNDGDVLNNESVFDWDAQTTSAT